MRFRIALFVCWLIFIFNIEQLLEPIHFSSATYLFLGALLIIALVTPRFMRIPLWLFLSAPIPIFLAVKAWTGELEGSVAILLTIAEVLAIGITTILSYWVSQAISEFENSVAHITIGQRDRIPESASVGQGAIYREVRRARNHQRPLTLMAVAIEEKSIQVALDRMVQEAQLRMMKQYVLSSVSKTLCEQLGDCDIVVESNGHFLVALPETTPTDLPILIDGLRQQVSAQVGVELRIGTASLPQDGLTLEGLIDKSMKEIQVEEESQPFIELEQVSLGRHNP